MIFIFKLEGKYQYFPKTVKNQQLINDSFSFYMSVGRSIQLEFLSHAENKTEVLVVLPQFDSNAAKLRKRKVITDMASISALLF